MSGAYTKGHLDDNEGEPIFIFIFIFVFIIIMAPQKPVDGWKVSYGVKYRS